MINPKFDPQVFPYLLRTFRKDGSLLAIITCSKRTYARKVANEYLKIGCRVEYYKIQQYLREDF